MKQAETLGMEASFTLNELKSISVFQHKSFSNSRSRTDLYLQNTVNNYLKTPEEMDADFCLEMNALKSHIKDQYYKADTNSRGVDRHHSYIPNAIHSGFMEENY